MVEANGPACPKLGPEPVLLSRKEVDALYDTLAAVTAALYLLGVEYIVTGGSLLGAVRQHSLLFCDDDIDVTIIDRHDGRGETSAYERVACHLAAALGDEYAYSVRPWEGGDKVRPKRMTSVFLDLFTLRRYESVDELRRLIGVKKNGQPQSGAYVNGIVGTIEASAFAQGEAAPLCPFWHFNTRKAVEMWPREVYRERELFPLSRELKFGPLTGICGPRTPVLLLRRAFGLDCFEVYYQSCSHKHKPGAPGAAKGGEGTSAREEEAAVAQAERKEEGGAAEAELPPLNLGGGSWEGGQKVALEVEHYLPMQPVDRVRRRPTLHGREQLLLYLAAQTAREQAWLREGVGGGDGRGRTVYMDGVFDLFHVGHLEAIRQCAALGSRVVIGVTGDADAASYKRPPVISEADRVAVVRAVREVDAVVCPCPLVVTQEFMREHQIDLVVHGFANDNDAKRQEEFFSVPIQAGKFRQIQYYDSLSTTAIIEKIRALPT